MLISNNKVTMYESLKNSINLSEEIIINVSFIRDSGLKLLIPELTKARSEGKSIKILTSDYNIAYECNLRVAINNGWLTPFQLILEKYLKYGYIFYKLIKE